MELILVKALYTVGLPHENRVRVGIHLGPREQYCLESCVSF